MTGMMNVELDLLTRARDRLVELDKWSSIDDPAPWKSVDGADHGVESALGAPITWDDHGGEVFVQATAELIVAMRGCVPYLIERLERAIQQASRPEELPQIADVELAEAILGETEGAN